MQRRRLKDLKPEPEPVVKSQEDDGEADEGKVDPLLLEAIIAEMDDELDYREGRKSERFDPPEPRPLNPIEWLDRSHMMVQRWRHRKLAEFLEDPTMIENLYGAEPIKFICHWLDVYEPRNAGKGLPTRMPFILFTRQEELIQFFHACLIGDGNGLVEKSRDMGATWCGCAYSIWLWRFVAGTAVGWGSANSDKLDRLGDAGSIFEKIRLCIRGLPPVFLPPKFRDDNLMHKRIINPSNGSSITGDIGDQIGRGGRTRLYLIDESAYLERPDMVEGALSENTRVRIDISSVSAPGTVFHRTRQAGIEWAPGKPISQTRHNVFLMDWRDHPEKNAEWAAKKKESFESRGLGHVYAREIERNYAAVAEGAIIKPEWVDAALDADKKLKLFMTGGKTVASLDVGEEGGASNACSVIVGQTLKALKAWQVRDTAISARNAINVCRPFAPCELQYDSIGIGAGIKAETNRLRDENLMPAGIILVPWHAGAEVLNPHERIVKNDEKSPTNKMFYSSIKAQGWWHVRQVFYNTWRAVTQGDEFPVEELICIDTSAIEVGLLHKLRDELCQVTATTATAKFKLAILKLL